MADVKDKFLHGWVWIKVVGVRFEVALVGWHHDGCFLPKLGVHYEMLVG